MVVNGEGDFGRVISPEDELQNLILGLELVVEREFLGGPRSDAEPLADEHNQVTLRIEFFFRVRAWCGEAGQTSDDQGEGVTAWHRGSAQGLADTGNLVLDDLPSFVRKAHGITKGLCVVVVTTGGRNLRLGL